MKNQQNVFLLGVLMSSVLISMTAQAEEKNYESNAITQFVPGGGPTGPLYPLDPDPEKPVEPIDPTNPDGKPNSGTHGPLTIDYASSWDFGQQKISSKDEKYIAKKVTLQDGRKVNPYMQVSDFRGTNGGWTLYVKQDRQFHNEDLLHSEIIGAEISWVFGGEIKGTQGDPAGRGPYATQESLVPGGGNVPIFMAPEGTGEMTWVRTMGTTKEITNDDTGVYLKVPGKSQKDAGVYRTTLTWTLSDIPSGPPSVDPGGLDGPPESTD